MISKKIFNIFNVYVFFLMLYQALSLIGRSSIQTYLTLGPAIVIALYYIFQAFQTPKTPYMKGLLCFILMMVVYGFIRLLGGETLIAGLDSESRSQSFLLMFMHQVPAILVFYILAKEGKIRDQDVKIWIIVFLIIALLEYRLSYNMFLERMALLHSNITDMTNNNGYLFLSVLPLVVFFIKKPVVQYSLMAFIGFFVLNSYKRGAIILFVLSFAFFLFTNLKNTTPQNYRKIIIFLVSIVSLVVGILYVEKLFVESDYFYSRYMATVEGNSSHRDEIYSSIFHQYANEYSVLQQLFGGGVESTLRYMHKYAHNDWMQLLSDCGLLGIIIYLVYWINCFKTIKKYRKKGRYTTLHILVGTAVLISFGRTLFSMSYNDTPVALSLAMGYGMAMIEKNIQHN